MKTHTEDKPQTCWVSGCGRRFSRNDNLNAHYKTHATRGGRNSYVSTLDEKSSDYEPSLCGQLNSEHCPIFHPKFEASRAQSILDVQQ